jgi:hypothetical protein
MFAMYNSPLNILYLVLSIGFGLLVIFLIVALFNLIGILRDVKKVTNKTKDTVDLVNHYLWQPIKIMMMILEKGKEVAAKTHKNKSKE